MTDKIVEQTKRQKFNEIFDMFDSDFDGIISSIKIDLSSVPVEVANVFQPLILEMEEIGQSLDRDEFVDASLRLFNVRFYLIMITILRIDTKRL